MSKLDNFVYTFLTPTTIILILVLFLIILAAIIIILIWTNIKEDKSKKDKILEVNNEVKKDKFDLETVTKLLEENMDKDRVSAVNEYENEQERKAIISYDELLKNASSLTINYEDEPAVDGVKVRKVEIEKSDKPLQNDKTPKLDNRSFYSYEREEEFLRVLKQFRANL